MVADDHAVVRTGLRMMLEREGTMDVVAEASDGDEVLRYVRGHRPDVLLLDLNMPGRDSLELIPIVREDSPSTAIVVLTMEQNPAFAREALQAGASGFVLKEAAHEELLRAIEVARKGGTYLDPSVGARLASLPDRRHGNPDGLTAREVEVLGRIVMGETNAEVASVLQSSVRTVETHRAHVQRKTGCASRSDLVRYANEHGLLTS